MVLATRTRPKKIAGHRNECCDGLLFPPEQAVKCTYFRRISREFFAILWKAFPEDKPSAVTERALAGSETMDFEEVGAERRGRRNSTDHQNFVAHCGKTAGEDRRFRLLHECLEFAG